MELWLLCTPRGASQGPKASLQLLLKSSGTPGTSPSLAVAPPARLGESACQREIDSFQQKPGVSPLPVGTKVGASARNSPAPAPSLATALAPLPQRGTNISPPCHKHQPPMSQTPAPRVMCVSTQPPSPLSRTLSQRDPPIPQTLSCPISRGFPQPLWCPPAPFNPIYPPFLGQPSCSSHHRSCPHHRDRPLCLWLLWRTMRCWAWRPRAPRFPWRHPWGLGAPWAPGHCKPREERRL